MHVATVVQVHRKLIPCIEHLLKAIEQKSAEWENIIKIGRTHTQDATPITLGQEFSGYAFQLKRALIRVKANLPYISELAQGGTAVGTGLNSFVGFDVNVADQLSKDLGYDFTTAPNKFEALASNDA